MATHSSVLAWRIPWTEELRGLHSMGSHTTVFQVEKKRTEKRGLFAFWGISG